MPLNAVIVPEVYKSSQQSPEEFIPTTMTELYSALTRSILLRYLHSHNEYGQREWNLKGFTDLPKELYDQFCHVTRVALIGMIEDRFVFDNLPNDFNTLDLMQSVPELYVDQGALISYNFFHLTLQEYLAAVNISQQPVEKQIKFFQTSNGSRPGRPDYSDCSIGSRPQSPDYFDVGYSGFVSDEEFTSEVPKAIIDRVNTTQPPGSQTSASENTLPTLILGQMVLSTSVTTDVDIITTPNTTVPLSQGHHPLSYHYQILMYLESQESPG